MIKQIILYALLLIGLILACIFVYNIVPFIFGLFIKSKLALIAIKLLWDVFMMLLCLYLIIPDKNNKE